jgi:hypothetical protein
MALTRATRHITSERVLTSPRRDYEEIGQRFRIHAAVSSAKPQIDPEWSVKALNRDSVGRGKESEKQTAGKGVAETIPEIRYAPNKKRSPGDLLKLHVTTQDMLRPGTEPNFGWVSPPKKMRPAERQKAMAEALAFRKAGPKIVVDEYDADPRTGKRIEESKRRVNVKSLSDNVEAKGLGRSLSSYVPGGNIGARAASALGVIVDELGKFRCPPGTPAANQFTDEFGTNCFVPPRAARRMLGRVGSWFNNHVAVGRYLEMLDRNEGDPQFAKNRLAMEAASQMLASKAVFDQRLMDKDSALEALRNMVGATGDTGLNADLWDTLDRLNGSGMWGIDWGGLFTDVEGNLLYDNQSTLAENLQKMDATLRQNYLDQVAPSLDDAAKAEMADLLVQRHHDVMRGFLEGVLHEFYDDPDTARNLKVLEFRKFDPGRDDLEGYWNTEAEILPSSLTSDGFGLTMQFNPMVQVLRPMIEDEGAFHLSDGKIRIVSTDGSGSEGAQWSAMQDFFKDQIDLERWKDRYATDISAARHQSLQASSRHTAYHEMGHLQQYYVIQKTILEDFNKRGVAYIATDQVPQAVTAPPDQWDNATWASVIQSVMMQQLPQEFLPEGFPPVGINAFEGSMLHILSGQYYQNLLLDYRYGEADSSRNNLALMLMEGMTELRALQRMGVIDSELIDQTIEWMNNRPDLNSPGTPVGPPRWSPPPPDTPQPPRPRLSPTNPPSALPGDQVPDDMALDIIPSGITWMVDKQTGEILPRQGPWALMERYFVSRFGGRPDDKTGGHQEIPRKSIARTWQWSDVSYAQLSGEESDRRFNVLRTDADQLLDRLDAGEQLDDDDLARLWLASKGMAQIADENARRRNSNAEIRQRRSDKFERNDAGKIFRKSKKPYKKNAQDGDEIYDEDKYRQAMIQIEESVPTRNPNAPLSWTRDPDGYGSEQAMDARRGMTAAEQAAMTKDLQERNKRYVHGGTDLEEAVEHAAKVRGETHDNTEAHPSPAQEISQTIMPVMDAMERNPVQETVEGYLIDRSDRGMLSGRSRGFVELRVVSTREESRLDYDGADGRTKIVVPKGSRGMWREDDNGEYAKLTLPPGDFEVVEDADGMRTLIPSRQESSSDFADRLLSDMDQWGRPRSVAEMRERAELEKVLRGRQVEKPRHVRSPFSQDSAVRNRMIKRRNDSDRGFADNGIEPFNPDFSARDTSLDQSSATRMILASDRLTDGDLLDNLRTSDGVEFSMTPEARDFSERSGSDAVVKKVSEAAEAWHEGVDRRVRSRVSSEELATLLETGSPSRPERSSMLSAFERNNGWPDGAPLESRPMFGHATHAVHEDIVDDILDATGRGGFPALRRAGFFDHSGESPHGPLSALGESDIVLRPEVSMRSAYGLGDILRDPVSLTRLNDNDPRRYASQLSVSRRGDGDTAMRMGNFLHAGLTGDFRGVQMRNMPPEVSKNGMMTRLPSSFGSADIPMETSIAGGFDLQDIERIDVPINSLGWQRLELNRGDIDFEGSGLASVLRNAGWSNSEIDFLSTSIADGRLTSVKSANLLRQHRVADADKIRFDRLGLNVQYTNSEGIDLFSRRDMTVSTDSGARIGRVRNVEEALLVRLNDEVGARQATLRPVVQEGMRSFRRRIQDRVSQRVSDEAATRIGGVAERVPTITPFRRRSAVQRLLSSDRVERLLRQGGLEEDNIDMMQLVGEMAIGFSSGGPAGVATVIARRAGREGIDFAVEKAVAQGWLSPEQSRKILAAADRVAPEGLPDAVTDAMSDLADRAIDSEGGDRARLLADAVTERVRELGIGDRGESARDKIRRRLGVGGERTSPPARYIAPDDPFDRIFSSTGRGERTSTPPTNPPSTLPGDPFDRIFSSTGLRSTRVSTTKDRFPELTIPEDGNFEGIQRFSREFGSGENDISQDALRRVLETLGDDFQVDSRWDDDSKRPLREVLEARFSYGDDKYLEIVQSDVQKLIANIEESDFDSEVKQKLSDDLKFVKSVMEISYISMDTKPKPPGRRDPFGDSDAPKLDPPTAVEIQSRIDEALSNAPQDFDERLRDALDIRNNRVEREVKRKEIENKLTNKIYEYERQQRYGPDQVEADHSAEVGKATRAKPAAQDVANHEPQDGVTRSPQDLQDLMPQTHAVADDLTSETHREELIDILVNNPELQKALEVIQKRIDEPYGAYENRSNDVDAREGTAYAGRMIVDALIGARGYDGGALRLTEEEIDLLQAVHGFTPLSRGGSIEPQKMTIENDGLPIGEGVDGAGLYFAVQGANPERQVVEGHDASIYAGKQGGVIRAVMSPTARMVNVTFVSKMVEEARLGFMGQALDANVEERNPIVALHRALQADPSNAKALEAFEKMMFRSADNSGENNNATGIAAILMGYDGLSSYSENSSDNRVILYNRTSVAVSRTLHTPSEYDEMKPWERLQERASKLAEIMDIPVNMLPEERTQWILAETERRLESLYA